MSTCCRTPPHSIHHTFLVRLVLGSVHSAFVSQLCLSGVPVCVSFFFWCPSVPFVSFNSCRVLAAHSHTLTPKKLSVTPECQQAWFPLQFDRNHSEKHRSAIRLMPAISRSITNSQSLSHSLFRSPHLSTARKKWTNIPRQVNACNKDTSYSLKFHHHFRANGYLTYQMTLRKDFLCAHQLYWPVYACVSTELMYACFRSWVASSGYEFCPVLHCSGPDMD